ncbi:MAG: hypothetical protein Q4G43_08875 [Mobilicoccus sp.]|nr:hypothetical protein [Mobilicoccus sp.]
MTPPGPTPSAPVPAPPPQAQGGRDLADVIRALEDTDPGDLDATLAAADEAHSALRARLGQAGGP